LRARAAEAIVKQAHRIRALIRIFDVTALAGLGLLGRRVGGDAAAVQLVGRGTAVGKSIVEPHPAGLARRASARGTVARSARAGPAVALHADQGLGQAVHLRALREWSRRADGSVRRAVAIARARLRAPAGHAEATRAVGVRDAAGAGIARRIAGRE